jgi:hypothetical protein
LIPVVITLVVTLFLYGYLSPVGLSPTAIFGSSYASLFGGTLTGGATPGTGSILTGTYSPLLPSGLVGLATFQMIHRRVSSMTRSMTAPRRSSPDEMMRKMNLQNIMPGMIMGTGAAGAAATVARELPSDITKPQFTLLNSYKQGHKNPKEVAKAHSMDKKEVERMTNSLVSSGYLTKENKLTEK